MNTIFIGGSRHISRLPAEVKKRLDNVIASGHQVIVGDANGADKAVQKHFFEAAYRNVTIFCSGGDCRNNLGQWDVCVVKVPGGVRGFQYYAAKDRDMAKRADFGLMIWDGKSAGTILNVLRLVRAGKIAVLFSVPEKRALNFKAANDWDVFLETCSLDLRSDLRERATPEEWINSQAPQQSSFLDARESGGVEPQAPTLPVNVDEKLTADINEALATGDLTSVINTLGDIAKARGMGQVAKDTGLAGESLYRSLETGGNPEFATVIKVMASFGLRLVARRVRGEETTRP